MLHACNDSTNRATVPLKKLSCWNFVVVFCPVNFLFLRWISTDDSQCRFPMQQDSTLNIESGAELAAKTPAVGVLRRTKLFLPTQQPLVQILARQRFFLEIIFFNCLVSGQYWDQDQTHLVPWDGFHKCSVLTSLAKYYQKRHQQSKKRAFLGKRHKLCINLTRSLCLKHLIL